VNEAEAHKQVEKHLPSDEDMPSREFGRALLKRAEQEIDEEDRRLREVRIRKRAGEIDWNERGAAEQLAEQRERRREREEGEREQQERERARFKAAMREVYGDVGAELEPWADYRGVTVRQHGTFLFSGDDASERAGEFGSNARRAGEIAGDTLHLPAHALADRVSAIAGVNPSVDFWDVRERFTGEGKPENLARR
jgi:hypothetical protein